MNDEQIFRSIIEYASDAVVVTNSPPPNSSEKQKILFVNRSYLKMTGYRKDEVIGKSPKILQGPATDPKELYKLRQAIESKEPGHAKLINYRKTGEKFWTSISIFPIKNEAEEPVYWVGIKRDITSETQAFEEINTTLQELHHRVKNNLALLSGLMDLQARKENNAPLKRELQNLTSRIKSIANIHELLYEGKSLTHVDIKEAIIRVINNIISADHQEKEIKTNISTAGIKTININQAVPFSLIMNEVVTNSVNHGLKEKDGGEIHLILTQKNNEIQLKITDNGQGLPKDFNPDEINSMGILLIQILSQQLSAHFNYLSKGNGTTFTLRFTRQDIKGGQSVYTTNPEDIENKGDI